MRLLLIATVAAAAGVWTAPVEVRHEDAVCIAYQARLDGPYLVVRASVGPGWHTFAMDNAKRAAEKLAGKPALSVDKATEIAVSGGLGIDGPWYQTAPRDFSRPELRWFSWGFDKQAVFAAKVRRTGAPGGSLRVRGQACTETICKNIDVTIPMPAGGSAGAAELDLKQLVAAQ
jgi:hypothetical protein